MPINERGEFVRERDMNPGQEKEPLVQMAEFKRAFFAQSVGPKDKPADLLYWKGARLDHYRELLEKMKDYAATRGLTEFTDPYTQEVVNLEEFYDKIQRSIVYSEQNQDIVDQQSTNDV